MEKQPVLFYLDLTGCDDVAAFREHFFSTYIEMDNNFLSDTPFVLEETDNRSNADVVYSYQNDKTADAFADDFLQVTCTRSNALYKQALALKEEGKLQEAADMLEEARAIYMALLWLEQNNVTDDTIEFELGWQETLYAFEYTLPLLRIYHQLGEEDKLAEAEKNYKKTLDELKLKSTVSEPLYQKFYDTVLDIHIPAENRRQAMEALDVANALQKEGKIRDAALVLEKGRNVFYKWANLELRFVSDTEKQHPLIWEDMPHFFQYMLNLLFYYYLLGVDQLIEKNIAIYEDMLRKLKLAPYITNTWYFRLYDILAKIYGKLCKEADVEKAEHYRALATKYDAKMPQNPIVSPEGQDLVKEAWMQVKEFYVARNREYYIDAQNYLDKAADLYIEALEKGYEVDWDEISTLIDIMCGPAFDYEETLFPRLLEAYNHRSAAYESELVPYVMVYGKLGEYHASRNEKELAKAAYLKGKEIAETIDIYLHNPNVLIKELAKGLAKL